MQRRHLGPVDGRCFKERLDHGPEPCPLPVSENRLPLPWLVLATRSNTAQQLGDSPVKAVVNRKPLVDGDQRFLRLDSLRLDFFQQALAPRFGTSFRQSLCEDVAVAGVVGRTSESL